MSETKDPSVIYLQPECCADPSIGRLWCEDDMSGEGDCEIDWTKYTRIDKGAIDEVIAMLENSRDHYNALCHDEILPSKVRRNFLERMVAFDFAIIKAEAIKARHEQGGENE